MALVAVGVAIEILRPGAWLFALPAALPAASLAPWTGWQIFEEFDLLVLALLAGAYARGARGVAARARVDVPGVLAGLLAAWALLAALAVLRGMHDAGVASSGWFQGYTEPLNALRTGKSTLLAAVAWPPLRAQWACEGEKCLRRFAAGMVCGLILVCAAAAWERAAFPGLLDFSARYRTTAMFWEMHVGGGAIDAYLALAAPFAAWALWTARTRRAWACAALLVLCVAYSCLTTYSRGLYVAAALPLPLLGLLLLRRSDLAAGARLRRLTSVALVAAGLLAGVVWAFVAFGAAGALAVPAGVAAAALALRAFEARGPMGGHSAAALVLGAALLAEIVIVLGGGTYMFERLAGGEHDYRSRRVHWRHGLGLLNAPERVAWGLGAGRLPAAYAQAVPEAGFTGSLRLADAPARALLGGPQRPGLPGRFGMAQRLPDGRAHRVVVEVRAVGGGELLASVCERHLLYDARCRSASAQLSGEGDWRRLSLALAGSEFAPSTEFLRRPRAFELAVVSPGTPVEVRRVALLTSDGRDLLVNGDFSGGLAHWLASAQGHYVPWHIDDVWLEVLIERGAIALAILVAIVVVALTGLFGALRARPTAPFVLASLLGALAVGTVVSVFDVPRVAWLLQIELMMGLLALSTARNGMRDPLHARARGRGESPTAGDGPTGRACNTGSARDADEPHGMARALALDWPTHCAAPAVVVTDIRRQP